MSELSKRFTPRWPNGGDTFNRKGATDRYWLKRFVVHTNDPAEASSGLIKEHAMREDGWVIFCLHGVGSDLGWEPWDAASSAQLCDFLKKKAIRGHHRQGRQAVGRRQGQARRLASPASASRPPALRRSRAGPASCGASMK